MPLGAENPVTDRKMRAERRKRCGIYQKKKTASLSEQFDWLAAFYSFAFL